MRIDISESFHKFENPKFPLYVDVEVTHYGKSSSRKVYTLLHENSSSPYAVCQIDDVLVDGKSRKPMPFPSWWQEKFSYINCAPKEPLDRWPSSVNLVMIVKEDYLVLYEDIDTNVHTNYSTYVKFCYDSIYKGVCDAKFRMLKSEHLTRGCKSMTMTFHGETNYRDLLTVELFEDSARFGGVFCYVRKANGDKCCTVCFEFYSEGEPEITGKL